MSVQAPFNQSSKDIIIHNLSIYSHGTIINIYNGFLYELNLNISQTDSMGIRKFLNHEKQAKSYLISMNFPQIFLEDKTWHYILTITFCVITFYFLEYRKIKIMIRHNSL